MFRVRTTIITVTLSYSPPPYDVSSFDPVLASVVKLAERRIRAIQMLQVTSNTKDETEGMVDNIKSNSIGGRRGLLVSKAKHRRSILTLQADETGKQCVVVDKSVLTSSNEEDVEALRNAAHYSIYAQWIYFHVRMVVEDLLSAEAAPTFIRDFDMISPLERFSMARFEAPYTQLFYANFHNGLAATPYAIMVDEKEKAVVITVRGTMSLEDWVR